MAERIPSRVPLISPQKYPLTLKSQEPGTTRGEVSMFGIQTGPTDV